MRPLENDCRPHREIQLALIAAVVPSLASGDALTTGASRARCTLRPKPRLKIDPRRLLVVEHSEKLEGRNCTLAHGTIVDNSLEGLQVLFRPVNNYFSAI